MRPRDPQNQKVLSCLGDCVIKCIRAVDVPADAEDADDLGEGEACDTATMYCMLNTFYTDGERESYILLLLPT